MSDPMSVFRLIVASLLYHWRMNLAVACGVAAAAAVLTGALLVGDSMHGSLRNLTFRRLGRIDEVLLTDRFFREELAEELASRKPFREHFSAAAPAILLRASLQSGDPESGQRANRVNLIACDRRFWKLASDPAHELSRRQVVLNKPLADKLGVGVDDEVLVYLAPVAAIPTESLLGRKDKSAESLRLSVRAIIPAKRLGRFGLHPSQQEPLNAYVSLAALQRTLELTEPKRVNAMLVAGNAADVEPSSKAHDALGTLLRPTPADFGLRIEKVEREELSYFNVTSDRMLLDEAVEDEIVRALADERIQPVLTYLANKIDTKEPDRSIPPRDRRGGIAYSTITAMDFAMAPPFGPLRRDTDADAEPIGPLDDRGDGQPKIVLNRWAADDLDVQPGDTIYVSYFEPESTHGEGREQTKVFELAEIARLEGPAADPALTPAVPNLSDADSMASWNPPFRPFYWGWLRIRGRPGDEGHKDEDYWQEHGATPKAFVSLTTGRELWGSRFGRTTSIRVQPGEGMTVESLRRKLRLDPAALGFVFQPVKQQGLDASEGTTPFNLLFLGFSFFIIAAAMMLVALMFRLGIDRRAGELGILAAVGFGRRRVALLLSAEGLLIAVSGSLVGVPMGIAYAAVMLYGLRTWWVDAVVTPFLRLYVTGLSLAIGVASGVIVALLAVLWSVWRTRKISPQRLLARQTTAEGLQLGRRSRLAGSLAVVLMIGAMVLGLLATSWGEDIRALAFFGAGSMVLVAVLAAVWARLQTGAIAAAVAVGGGNLVRLALRNAARNPGRSTLSIGLVASACFLIVAVSAFHLDPSRQVPTPGSGNGGFALVAEADQPIYYDFNTVDGRSRSPFSQKDREVLAGTNTFALRVNQGEDASCLNLYKPRQPRVLGVPKDLIERGDRLEQGGFAWAATDARTEKTRQNPWRLLQQDLEAENGTPRVPVVIDMNTAMYSLHLWKGVGETYDLTDGRGEVVRLQVVGLLSNSIFQGDLLIGEESFKEHFPEAGGYRFFLTEVASKQTDNAADTLKKQTEDVAGVLNRTLGDYGLSVQTSGERLAGFLVVQNTYLLTFQSLGGLGLLLGTFGLAAVQLRNVLERRNELALLRAAGFRRSTLGAIVMLENGLLLGGGLAGGVLAALVAVLPHLLTQAATLPWGSLAATLGAVLAVGLISGLAAVRAAVAAPLMGALREER